MIPLHDLNPTRRKPIVTVGLIVANAVVFLYELSLGPGLPGFLQQAAFVPARLFGLAGAAPQVGPAMGSILLSMFLHGGWAHILGNMLYLWIFGDNVEDRLGHLRFLAFYLLAGYAASFAHALASPHSTLPSIGASGAISGVLGAYLLLYPGARVVTLVFLGFFITTAEIPALVYLPIWFLLQFFSGIASLGAAGGGSEAGGVAWFAHIGGFLSGPLLLWLLGGLRGGRRRPPARQWEM